MGGERGALSLEMILVHGSGQGEAHDTRALDATALRPRGSRRDCALAVPPHTVMSMPSLSPTMTQVRR